jgi:hypothetical protein
MTPARAGRRVAARAGPGQLKSVSARVPPIPVSASRDHKPPARAGLDTARAGPERAMRTRGASWPG